MKDSPRLDSKFASRLIRLIHLTFSYSPVIYTYIVLLIASLLYELLAYKIGITLPSFYTILPAKDTKKFYRLVVVCCGLYASVSVVRAVVSYLCGLFAINVRRKLTTDIHDKYVYGVGKIVGGNESPQILDNPDQRLTQDVERFADQLRVILEQLAIDPLLIAFYTYQTSTVGQGIWGPIVIFVFFILAAMLCRYLLQPLVPLVVKREKAEGDFRYLHVRLRENADSITFLGGQKVELSLLNSKFSSLVSIQNKILLNEMPIKAATVAIDYVGALVCYFIVAVPIFKGKYDDRQPAEIAALISESLFYSLYLIYRFTMITKLADRFSELAGYTTRIAEFLEALDDLQRNNLSSNNKMSQNINHTSDSTTPLLSVSSNSTVSGNSILNIIEPPDSDYLGVRDLTYHSPSGQLLGANITFSLTTPQRMLIHGPSGCGKTTLLRILAGLYTQSSGSFILPKSSTRMSVLFLPQQTYMLASPSLRAQVTYPLDSLISDTELKAILQKVGVGYLLDREKLNEDNWIEDLSPGEKQRIAFARVLVHRPLLAVLDEPAASLDSETERDFIQMIGKAGVGCIVVSHHHVGMGYDVVMDYEGGRFVVK